MTSSVRPLYGLKTKVSTQELGSKVFNDQALKEITNRVVVRPSKLKYSRPMSKLSGTKRASEGVNTEGNVGPPDKIPIFNFTFGSNSFMGRPSSSRPSEPTSVDPTEDSGAYPKSSVGDPFEKNGQEE